MNRFKPRSIINIELLRDRETKNDRTSLPRIAFQLDLSRLRFCQSFGNGQAQTEAWNAGRLLAAIKTVKDVLQFFSGNAFPEILHTDFDQ